MKKFLPDRIARYEGLNGSNKLTEEDVDKIQIGRASCRERVSDVV